MKKIAIFAAVIGFICFAITSASGQNTDPATAKTDKNATTRTSLTPAVLKSMQADSTTKVKPANTAAKGTAATADDKSQANPSGTKCQTAAKTSCCQKKCATAGTKCTMPCADKKTDVGKTKADTTKR